MVLVLLTEYIFGAEVNSSPTKINGGNEMRISMMGFAILPDKLGSNVCIDIPEITATDMIKTISALDERYDYKIYKEFEKQYIIVALHKGQNDTLIDMQYMTLNNLKAWYNDKLDEALGRTKEDI